MTYAGFLLRYLLPPLLFLGALTYVDRRRGPALPPALCTFPPGFAVAAHVLIAVVYTTPWDNYLVATDVWGYERPMILGITLGWVPIEEYTFFVLQSLMTGWLLLTLARRIPPAPAPVARPGAVRLGMALFLGLLWLAALALLVSGWPPGTYLALQSVWALPPIAVQAAFGGDLLWRYRRLLLATIGAATLYLALADARAIAAGTWAINPEKSLHLLLGGVLPLEEFTFFLLTNTLLAFGITLALSKESHERIPSGFWSRKG